MTVTIELSERDAGYLKDDVEAHIQDYRESIAELENVIAEERGDAAMIKVCKIGIKYWKRVLKAIKEAQRAGRASRPIRGGRGGAGGAYG